MKYSATGAEMCRMTRCLWVRIQKLSSWSMRCCRAVSILNDVLSTRMVLIFRRLNDFSGSSNAVA